MDTEQFRAKRRESLADGDALLRDAVEDGLTAHIGGNMSWSTLIAAASKLWLDNFQAESPGARYATALGRFQKALGDSLAKTSTPITISDGQIDRITRWVSTYAINSGTITGGYAAGNRFKQWVTMSDDDVRDIHKPLHLQVRPIGGTFNVAGTSVGFPAEPVGPPPVWIECRCVARPASREGEAMSLSTFVLGPEDDVEEDEGFIVSNNITASADVEPTWASVMLIPAESDPIVAASSEPAHVTFVWLGKNGLDDFEGVEQAVRMYAQDLDGPLVVPVAKRGTLGEDDADVVFLEPSDSLIAMRDGLMVNEPIRAAYDAAEQFPDWTPHVTLGYPETPALAEYDGTEVTFDRIGLWVGEEHWDYQMGGGTVTAAATVTETEPVDNSVETGEGEEDGLSTLIPIHGVLAPEGILSGDGRGFREGALTSRKLPLHYRYEFVGSHGGNQTSQAVTVGTINEVWRHTDGMNRFRGFIDMTRPYADQALADILQGIGFNSIDADAMEQDVSMYFDSDGNMIDQPAPTAESAGKQPETWYSKVRVAGLTQVPIQAFPETYTALGHDFEEDMSEEQLAASASALEDCGCGGQQTLRASGGTIVVDLTEFSDEQLEEYNALDPDAQEVYAREHDAILAAGFAPGTKDGPGWITNPRATKQIRDYWTKPGEVGYAKIGWGTPGDFNRCRALLGEYVQNPEWLAGLCANMHYEVLKTWPGPKRGDKGHSLAASATDQEIDVMTLVAAGAKVYPSTFFSEPTRPGSYAMTINRETRQIHGYAADWSSCHIGIQGMCRKAPRSNTDYSYFRKGIVSTDAGEQSVGLITMGIGHASQYASAAAATAHYDDTNAVRAYINIGENSYGIWYSGVLAPWVTDADIDAMLAIRRVSGDWRNWSGRRDDLEMVGLVCVNTEGFQLAASAALDGMVGGVQTCAIGLGAVSIDEEYEELVASATITAPSTDENEAFLARAVVRAMEMVTEKQRHASIRQQAFEMRRREALRELERIN